MEQLGEKLQVTMTRLQLADDPLGNEMLRMQRVQMWVHQHTLCWLLFAGAHAAPLPNLRGAPGTTTACAAWLRSAPLPARGALHTSPCRLEAGTNLAATLQGFQAEIGAMREMVRLEESCADPATLEAVKRTYRDKVCSWHCSWRCGCCHVGAAGCAIQFEWWHMRAGRAAHWFAPPLVDARTGPPPSQSPLPHQFVVSFRTRRASIPWRSSTTPRTWRAP